MSAPSLRIMFTEKEKELAQKLKTSGLKWNPEEGDWFWAADDVSHQFYLGENLPSSYSFQKDQVYCFDNSMTWHIQQGGLNLDKFVWLPTWEQCRRKLKEKKLSIELKDENGTVQISAKNGTTAHRAAGQSDIEAIYSLILQLK